MDTEVKCSRCGGGGDSGCYACHGTGKLNIATKIEFSDGSAITTVYVVGVPGARASYFNDWSDGNDEAGFRKTADFETSVIQAMADVLEYISHRS